MVWRRLAGAVLAAGLALLAAPAAGAQAPLVEKGPGHETDPQGYRDKPAGGDWLGAYKWRGQLVWCVQYSLLAPDSNVEYKEGDELLSKGGARLRDDVAGSISYLLLRYANTQSNDEAAALAHLLHTWTAYEDPANGISLDPNSDFRHIAYNSDFHFRQLGDTNRFGKAQEAVKRLEAEAAANRGPWAAKVSAPAKEQVIGTPDTWVVDVTKTDGGQVAGAPVTVEVTDATLEVSGGATAELTTSTDGKALAVQVVPTGPNPSVTVKLDSPADRPRVHVPANNDMQRIVTTGGEKKLTANASTTAKTAPGVVKVAKTDAETGKAIAGVALKVTGPDGKAAKRQDDSELTGPEGTPLVLQTSADGTAEVPDLRTPQEVCLVEVAPAKGYEEFFDPNAPPKVCGTVEAGQTLALALTNKPDKPVVPITIPAGSEGAGVVAKAAFTTEVSTGALVGFGGVVLIGATLVGLLVRRRATARR
ncbi:collagen binding domain-containing protein [Saccharothrix saharensis]|uniref:MSCRAMM family protein n=1 Tax=Saccharothrix saharensis TaxID=571190 RepID=UPI0036859CD4